MKQKMILTVLVLAFAVLAGLVLAYIDEGAPAATPDNSAMSVAAQETAPVPPAPAQSVPSELSESSAESEAPRGFLLGEYEGWLAVYPAGSAEPTKVYDVLVQTLPPYDRERLTAGIPAADEDALVLLLEDYIS